MAEDQINAPLIRTKLHRPPVPGDHLHRQYLLDRLDQQRRHRPLTLVSAPAGYGKSTLVSCWLEVSDLPSAWVSLDKNDSDLHLFLSYFVAALQTIFPDACQQTRSMLNAVDMPPLPVLAGCLINELDQIDKAFILVMDDYHFIRGNAVHELLSELLKHPPGPMHLVLTTRRDPSLPLATLRARSQMTEIRVQELRFSAAETAAFLQQILKTPVDETTAAVLEERTEGWVTGLRLAGLSLRHRSDIDRILAQLPEDNRYVMDYIVAEVLSQQPSAIQEYLLTTAILERFCAPLCQAVCVLDTESQACEMPGQEFLDWLQRYNLFVISIDDQQRWFRYHHLFRQLLKRQLKREFSLSDINNLHKHAGAWFGENGFVEEALHHMLKADDAGGTARLVTQHRNDVMNQEQWHRLTYWMRVLPSDIIAKSPELLITQAWSFWNRMRLPEMADVLDQAEPLLAAMSSESEKGRELKGELYAMRGIQYFLSAPCDGPRALDYARRAMARIPRQQHSARGLALIVLGISFQMTGDIGRAYSVVLEALNEKETLRTTQHTRLLTTLGFLQWAEADLIRLEQTAQELFKLSMELELTESLQIARYFLGVCHYCRNDLDGAERNLTVAAKTTNVVNIFNFTHSAFVLALVYQSQGRPSEARELNQMVISYSLKTGHTAMLQMAYAFEAELAVRQGNFTEANHWGKTFAPEPFRAAHRFYVPQLTMAKVLLAKGTPESQGRAIALLNRLHEFFTSIHNTRFLIDVLALQALAYDALGDEPKALSALGKSITLAEPGGFIRPFLDLGREMADLLNRLARQNIDVKYVGRLLDDFRKEAAGTVKTGPDVQTEQSAPRADIRSDETLSKREIEVLALLPQGMSNKEIAEQLFISPETVKRHLYNIYQKLYVSTRREAAKKATALGII